MEFDSYFGVWLSVTFTVLGLRVRLAGIGLDTVPIPHNTSPEKIARLACDCTFCTTFAFVSTCKTHPFRDTVDSFVARLQNGSTGPIPD